MEVLKIHAGIVIPVFNQLPYTARCLESLAQSDINDSQIIMVDNGSTDGTAEFLAARSQIQTIRNQKNLGCGTAWTQGVKISKSTWTVVMNNDIVVSRGWLEALVDFGETKHFNVVSPAICHGELDYDLPSHAAEFVARMKNAIRRNVAHGSCFMVHRRVFENIGCFDADQMLGGYEDDDFFRRARRAGFRLAVTGSAFIHHFGSVTQNSIKAGSNGKIKSLGDPKYYRHKTGQTWLKRKVTQARNNLRAARWRYLERLQYGRTLSTTRIAGTIKHL